MGVDRIRRNLGFGEIDVVAWCKKKILKTDVDIERHGKNWYVHIRRMCDYGQCEQLYHNKLP